MLQITETLQLVFQHEVLNFDSRFWRTILPFLFLAFGVLLAAARLLLSSLLFEDRFRFILSHDFKRIHTLLKLKFGQIDLHRWLLQFDLMIFFEFFIIQLLEAFSVVGVDLFFVETSLAAVFYYDIIIV